MFIDGVSYKNDVLDGGVVGQDSSRGSPFPQNSKARNQPKPSYDRFQPGLSGGGPIIKDKFLVFGAYEENRQNRDAQVFLGGTPAPASLNLQRYVGTFPSEFREKLLFGKATYQPKAGQTMDVSYSLRTESDVRGFGSQTSFEAAENVENRVDSVLGRWLVPGRGSCATRRSPARCGRPGSSAAADDAHVVVISWYSSSVLTAQTSSFSPRMFRAARSAVSMAWSWLLYLCRPLRPIICRFSIPSR